NYAFVFRREGAKYHLAANHGFAADYREWMERQSISIGRETLVGRTAFEGRTVHIPDVLADPERTKPLSPSRMFVCSTKFRTKAGSLKKRAGTSRNFWPI